MGIISSNNPFNNGGGLVFKDTHCFFFFFFSPKVILFLKTVVPCEQLAGRIEGVCFLFKFQQILEKETRRQFPNCLYFGSKREHYEYGT